MDKIDELNFFSTELPDNNHNHNHNQTGGGKINSENIDIIRSYRKKNRELHKRIQDLEEENKMLRKRLT